MKVRHLIGLGALLPAFAGAVQAQQPQHQFLHNSNPAAPLFACGAQTVGQVACQAGVRCKCMYEAFGNLMRGFPPGTFHWDCSPKHGSCLVDIPAETTGTYGNPSGPIIVAPFGTGR